MYIYANKKSMKKRTKIIATISDRNCNKEFIQELFDNGVNVIRLNTAHQTFEGSKKVIENIRKVSDKIAILVDTKGPEIRTIDIDVDLVVKTNDVVYISDKKEENHFNVSYPNFYKDIIVGNSILIDDGKTEIKVTEINNAIIKCIVKNDGEINNKKSINVPGVSINLPALKPKDIEYINFSIEHNLDFIAHSFVRKKEDVIAVKSLLEARGSTIKVIAKIENQEGVDNIDSILEYADGVMVARGDMALEIPVEQIPFIQKSIIEKCINLRKPVIVATQMLHSMIEHPRPTRAEISDVANAVYDGTDALMLSGETAYGKYPVESVKLMSKIALEVERTTNTFRDIKELTLSTPEAAFLAKHAVEASRTLPVKAIIADTTGGKTIRALSAYRGKINICAQCYNKGIMRELALSYGVIAHYMKAKPTSHEFLKEALEIFVSNKTFVNSDLVVVIAGNFGHANSATFIEISTVENLMQNMQGSV